MSDSQFEFEQRYENDFFDDDDDDTNDDDTNNQNDSGLEEKSGYQNSYETISSDNDSIRKPQAALQTPQWKTKGKGNGSRDTTPMRKSDPYKSYLSPGGGGPVTRRAQSDPRGKKQKKGKMAPANRGTATNVNSSPNIVIQRVLSASRKKTSALHNVIYELQQNVEALTISNRDLRRNSRIQDREIRKIDDTEAQLPMLMKKHSVELNVMHEKYRRQKEVAQTLAENIKKVDNELLKTKDKLQEYQVMVKEKNLGERIELSRNIENLKKIIEQKDNKTSELTRTVVLQKKNHTRVIKEKNDRYAKAMEQIDMLENVQKDLLDRLHDRERALEVTNIYSRRLKDKQMVMFSPKDPIAPILKKCQEDDSFEIIKNISARSKSPERTEKNEKKKIVNANIEKNTGNCKTDTLMVNGNTDVDIVGINEADIVKRTENEASVPPPANNESSLVKSPVKTVLRKAANDSDTEEDVVEETEESSQIFLTEAKSREASLVKNSLVTNNLINNSLVNNPPVNNNRRESVNDDDFYQLNSQMENDSLGETELHEKLDQLNEMRKQKEYFIEIKRNQEELQKTVEIKRTQGNQNTSNTSTEKRTIPNVNNTEKKVDDGVKEKNKSNAIPLEKNIEDSKKQVAVEAKNTEQAEHARKRKLLLAKMQAIDKGENPNDVTPSVLNVAEEKKKLPKKPIFLGGSPKKTNPKSVNNNEEDTALNKKSTPSPEAKPTSKPPVNIKPPVRRTRFPPEIESVSGGSMKNSHSGGVSPGSENRRNSWEFKRTDENLHKGLPAHADLSPETSPVSSAQPRNNKEPLSSKRNATNRINLDYDPEPTDTYNYSPTMVDTGQHGKRTNKKNAVDLFQQFEDPFKSEAKVKVDNKREGSGVLFDKNEKNEKNDRSGRVSESIVIDDLEEMFIL